jgi:hypothetical protein
MEIIAFDLIYLNFKRKLNRRRILIKEYTIKIEIMKIKSLIFL